MFIDSRPQQTGKPRRGDMSSQDGTRGLYMSPLRGLPDISIAVFYKHTTPTGLQIFPDENLVGHLPRLA